MDRCPPETLACKKKETEQNRIDMITKETFFEAYNAHPPNKAQIFFYRYFGNTVGWKDAWLGQILIIFWISTVVGVIVFAATKLPLKGITMVFAFTFIPFYIFALTMVITNKLRLRKIRLSLGFTKDEYTLYATMYL